MADKISVAATVADSKPAPIKPSRPGNLKRRPRIANDNRRKLYRRSAVALRQMEGVENAAFDHDREDVSRVVASQSNQCTISKRHLNFDDDDPECGGARASRTEASTSVIPVGPMLPMLDLNIVDSQTATESHHLSSGATSRNICTEGIFSTPKRIPTFHQIRSSWKNGRQSNTSGASFKAKRITHKDTNDTKQNGIPSHFMKESVDQVEFVSETLETQFREVEPISTDSNSHDDRVKKIPDSGLPNSAPSGQDLTTQSGPTVSSLANIVFEPCTFNSTNILHESQHCDLQSNRNDARNDCMRRPQQEQPIRKYESTDTRDGTSNSNVILPSSQSTLTHHQRQTPQIVQDTEITEDTGNFSEGANGCSSTNAEVLPDILNAHSLPPYSTLPQISKGSCPRVNRDSVGPHSSRLSSQAITTTATLQRLSRLEVERLSTISRQNDCHNVFSYPQPNSEDEPKHCCGSATTQTISFRWFIVMIAFVGLCCAIVGVILGALKASGREHLTVALLMISVGIALIVVSAIAWRLTSHNAPSCRMMLGLNMENRVNRRHFEPRAPPLYGRSHHPFAAMMYPEFQFRPPPPSYQASMQEYRLQSLNGEGCHPVSRIHVTSVSPPPTYRSNARRSDFTRSQIVASVEDNNRSRPPSYRSQTRSIRPRATDVCEIINDAGSGEQMNRPMGTTNSFNTLPQYNILPNHVTCPADSHDRPSTSESRTGTEILTRSSENVPSHKRTIRTIIDTADNLTESECGTSHSNFRCNTIIDNPSEPTSIASSTNGAQLGNINTLPTLHGEHACWSNLAETVSKSATTTGAPVQKTTNVEMELIAHV